MEKERVELFLGMLALLGCLFPVLFFLHAQQLTLQWIAPANRQMRPGQVWLQLIPLFGLIWQFFVISRLSRSIQLELSAPTGDTVFAEPIALRTRPTYSVGIQYAILFCGSLLPIPGVKICCALAGLVCWIRYWIQLPRYEEILKERSLLRN